LAAARLAPPPPPAALPERKTAAARALLPDIGRLLPWSGAPGGDPKAQHSIRPCRDCSKTPIGLVAAAKGLWPSTTIVAVERPDGAGNVSRAASYECVRLPDGGKFPDRRACVRASSGRLEIFVYQGCARLTVGLLGLCDLRVQAAGALFAVVNQTVAETPIIRVFKINLKILFFWYRKSGEIFP
jgi:hypothetical protein